MKQLVFLLNMLFLLEFFLCMLILWCHFYLLSHINIHLLRQLFSSICWCSFCIYYFYLNFHVYDKIMMSFLICFATSTFIYCVICFALLRDLMNHINDLSIYVFLIDNELRLQHRNVFNDFFLINVFFLTYLSLNIVIMFVPFWIIWWRWNPTVVNRISNCE